MASRLAAGPYFRLTGNVVNLTAPYTIMAWVMVRSDLNTYTHFWRIQDVSGDYDHIGTDADGTTFRAEVTRNGETALTGSTLNINQWYHMAAVRYSVSDYRVFLNGSCDIGPITRDISGRGSGDSLWVGVFGHENYPADMRISSMKIYSAALMPKDIKREALQISPYRNENLFAFYPFFRTSIRTNDYFKGSNFTEYNGTITDEDDPPIPWAQPTLPRYWMVPFFSNGVSSSVPAYLEGASAGTPVSSNIPAYTKGQTSTTSNIPAYTYGQASTSSNIPAYTKGYAPYATFTGSFNIDTGKTAGQTQAITGVGFTPKLVIFWWSGATAASNGARGEDICFGMGAMTGASSRFAIGGMDDDASASSTGDRFNHDDVCIASYLNGTQTLDGSADWGSFDTDGFTITIDDQFSTALRVSYLVLGGDDLTNVYIGQGTMPVATGNYNVTGVSFQPDCLMVFNPNGTATGAFTGLKFAFGIATSSSNQGVVSLYGHDASATTLTKGYGYDGEVNATVSFSSVGDRESFVYVGSDGFTLNHLEGGIAWEYYFIALKGGQYKVGQLDTRTDGNDIVETEPGFSPVALLFYSVNRVKDTQDTQTDHLSVSVGAATSSFNRVVQAAWDENNLADTETATANYDNACYAFVKDDAIVGLMDIKSIDTSGFTAVMDDTDPSACWVTYLAIGPALEGTETSSNIPAYTKGQEVTTSNIPAYLKGQASDLSNIPAFAQGNAITSSNVPAYTAGTAEASSNAPAYLGGQTSDLSSVPAFLQGNVVTTSNIPAYLTGEASDLSNVPAFTQGGVITSSNIPAYLEGEVTGTETSSSTLAFLAGSTANALRPDADITVNDWQNQSGGSVLYSSIDELYGIDTDYAWMNNAKLNDYFEVRLSDPGGAPTAGDWILRWRSGKVSGGMTVTVKCELRQGTSTVVCSDEQPLTSNYQLFEHTLTTGEKALITDANDLRLRFIITDIS